MGSAWSVERQRRNRSQVAREDLARGHAEAREAEERDERTRARERQSALEQTENAQALRRCHDTTRRLRRPPAKILGDPVGLALRVFAVVIVLTLLAALFGACGRLP